MHTSTIRIFSSKKYKLIYTVALKSVKHTELSSVKRHKVTSHGRISPTLPNKILGKEEIEKTYIPILQNWADKASPEERQETVKTHLIISRLNHLTGLMRNLQILNP